MLTTRIEYSPTFLFYQICIVQTISNMSASPPAACTCSAARPLMQGAREVTRLLGGCWKPAARPLMHQCVQELQEETDFGKAQGHMGHGPHTGVRTVGGAPCRALSRLLQPQGQAHRLRSITGLRSDPSKGIGHRTRRCSRRKARASSRPAPADDRRRGPGPPARFLLAVLQCPAPFSRHGTGATAAVGGTKPRTTCSSSSGVS